jgi:hypothetical protein
MKYLGLLAACVLLAGCGSATVGGNTQTPTPSEIASAPASPASSPSPTPSPLASPSPTPVCTTIQGGTTSRATITDVRVGMHPTYDRLVIEFSGGLPAYKLVPQDPSTFVGPFSGIPIKVAGKAGYHLYIYNMDIPPTYKLGNILTAYPELKQVVVMAVFEGQADIAIGLDHSVCPVVSTLSSPTRLVIDFPVQ